MSLLDVDSVSQTPGLDSLAEWLVTAMGIGFLLSLIALGILRLLHRYGPISASGCHSHASCFALIVAPVLCAIWIRPPLPIVSLERATILIPESGPVDIDDNDAPAASPNVVHEFGRVSDSARGEISVAAVPVATELPAEEFANAGVRLRKWLVGLWMVVWFVLTIRQLVTHLRTHRWSRGLSRETEDHVEAVAREIGLSNAAFAISDNLESPVTIGIFRPTVVVPKEVSDWKSSEMRMALRHELTHVCRRDVLWCTLLNFVAGFYWPLISVWMLQRKHRRLIEWVCDDAVLKSETLGVDYAEFLARIASRSSYSSATAGLLMAERSFVGKRIERLLDGNVNYTQFHFILKPLLLASIALMTLTLVAMRPSYGAAEIEQTVSDESPTSKSLVDDKVAARPVSSAAWDTQSVAFNTASDVLVVMNATDNRWPIDFNSQESRPRILAIGTSDELTKALQLKKIDGLISLQPYGFGYRSIELLAKSREGGDRQQRVRIPPKLVRHQDANSSQDETCHSSVQARVQS